MRAVIQRVRRASCTVNGQVTGEIERGLLILLGVAPEDTSADAQALAHKIYKLRLFSDEAGKMNLSLADVGGTILSVSQFTLFGDTRRGNRPSFSGAAGPEQGKALYTEFNAALRGCGAVVAEGIFGADMQIELLNDGPVTLLLDTAQP